MKKNTGQLAAAVKHVAGLIIFGCVVWLSYLIGIAFYFEPEHVATFWLTNGIVVGVLVASRRNLWPALFIVQGGIQWILNLSFSPEFAVIVTSVNSLSALVAADVICRLSKEAFQVSRLRHMLAFIGTVLVAEALNGLGGAFAVSRRVDVQFWSVWQTWTFATATGSLIAGGATISFLHLIKRASEGRQRNHWAENALLTVLMVAACHLVFSGTLLPSGATLGMSFVPLVFLIWSATRLGPERSLILLFLVSMQLVFYGNQGVGPFIDPLHTTYQDVLALQGFLMMNLVVIQILIALYAERAASLVELRQSRERFRTLVETTPDVVWEWDRDATYNYVSPRVRDLLGYEPRELIGKSSYDLMAPGEVDRFSESVSDHLRQGKAFQNLRHTNMHKDGRRIILESSGEPFFDNEGSVDGYRGIDRDITARVKAEEERYDLQQKLEAAKRIESLGVMAGGVAHDLNNILGPLVALPAILREDFSAIPATLEQREGMHTTLEVIEESAMRASRVVSDLLALGRRSRYQLSAFDLASLPALFLKSSQGMGLVSRYPGVNIATESGSAELMIAADSDALLRVIANLASNAFESTGNKGNVWIKAFSLSLAEGDMSSERIPPGDYCVLSVSDDGCGIDAATIDRVFEPFFSSKGPSEHSGSGLGLSVVHGIVKDHNGYIDLVSKAGEGTSFAVYIPELRDAGPGEASR